MPLVLETIDCMRASSELPVAVTDTQGVLATCCLLCGYERLFTWMYDAPDKVHHLFERVAQALIDWIIEQKKHSGEPVKTSFSQALQLPEGFGVVLSEDDAVSISPKAYREFCVPYNEKIFAALGGGMLHFCGDGTHQLENFANTRGLRGLHVIPMGNLEILTRVQRCLGDRFVLVAGEFMPSDPQRYYAQVLSSLAPRGLILVPYVFETLAFDMDKGGYIAADRDVLEWGRKVLDGIASFYAGN
jgi:uroporphyrinogen-III decarboxylase